jgi:oligopeptide/dipeptide ABC transporter ATP-binding protein
LLNLLISLKKEFNLTYLFITHDLNVVRYVCDEVAVMYAGRIVEKAPRDELFGNPKHPYTQLLLSSMLTSTSQHDEQLLAIKGEVPDPAHYPVGCRFHPRCPYVMDVCKVDPYPEMRSVGEKHVASCHLY